MLGTSFSVIEAHRNEIRPQPTSLAAKSRIARLAALELVAFSSSRRTSAVVCRI